jgi:hypothetical protein
MIWVAKPGTKIVIVDETERTMRDAYQSTAGVRGSVPVGSERVRCPIDLVPAEMKDITAREICEGKLYCLTFRKP